MSDVTVKKFAEDVGIPLDRLLSQLVDVGLPVKNPDETISVDEKLRLLDYLNTKSTDTAVKSISRPKKITLKRKTVTELRQASVQGRAKTVSVEVRKKRTYVKRTPIIPDEDVAVDDSEDVTAREATLEGKSVDSKDATALQDNDKIDLQQTGTEESAKDTLTDPLKDPSNAKQKVENEASAGQPKEAKQAGDPSSASETSRKTAQKAEGHAAKKDVSTKGAKKTKRIRQEKLEQEKGKADEIFTRSELHIASGKTSRRRKHTRSRSMSVTTQGEHSFERPTAPIVKEVKLPESITVGELAQKMSIKAAEVLKIMMNMGSMVTINQAIDQATAALIVEELGHKVELIKDSALEDEIGLFTEIKGEPVVRAPIVTVMGHVDHGKTSLLDYIRKTKVVQGEAGGITQHIGAYSVKTDKGVITFLDTPGHAAFTAMRARGAKITDIVVLVIAADDNVMPQTKEAIQHAKAANATLIVAINKIDKPEAQPDRIKQQLANEDVMPEDWGGDIIVVNISAETGEGIDSLLESILLQAEILELKAVKEGSAKGVIIESRLDKGRGPIASVLVQQGTLKKGDIVLAGREYGRIRAMLDENGVNVSEAGPSMPIEILGLSGTPNAGEDMLTAPDERKAREVALLRQTKYRETKLGKQQAAKLENMFSHIEEGVVNLLHLVIKTDVQGSAEALNDALLNLSTDEVKVKIVSSGVGGINESDVTLAVASKAVLIGFNVRADTTARQIVEAEAVDMRYYSVIYNVIDEVKQALIGLLAPEFKEEIVGIAEVRDVFKSPKFGAIAGCMVLEGSIKKSNPIRVLRDHVVIYEGLLESLRRFKDDVSEVKSGTECGIGIKKYNDVKAGDHIEVFERVEVARTL